MVKKILFIIFILLGIHRSFAHGKISVPVVECLGNVTNYVYTPPAGLTLASCKWYFGDGGTSTNFSPTHIYASKGFYTVIIDAVFTNSTSITDSLKMEVVNLPKAFFYRLPKTDTCFSKNKICYKDTSIPAIATQKITKRLLVWGDGTFNTSSTPLKGDVLCHVYAVPAKYTLKLEVTDIYGCKNSVITTTEILDDIVAGIYMDTSFIDCDNRQICVKNISQGVKRNPAAYKWLIDTLAIDTNAYFNSKKCIGYNKTRTGIVMLALTAPSGCKDTARVNFGIQLDPLPTFIDLSDTVFCSSDGSSSAEVNRVDWDLLRWSIDNSQLPGRTHQPQIIISEIGPGKHVLSAAITRGNCRKVLSRNFEVLGPLVNPLIFDNNQCFSNRQVFMVDTTKYAKAKNIIIKWTIEDPNGDNCTSNRANGQNLYKNCNYSVDWYTKHKYTSAKDSLKIGLRLTDTITGCTDSSTEYLRLRDCPPILKLDSVKLCRNDVFLDVLPKAPKKVSFNGGKNWVKFPVVMDSTFAGYYDLGMIFETLQSPWIENYGKDSIKIHKDSIFYYDTVYRKKFLHVYLPKIDTFSLKVYHCKPIRATVYLKNKKFAKGERLTVNFSDGIPFDITTYSDTLIDSVTHLFNSGAVSAQLCRIKLYSKNGCEYKVTFDVTEGDVISRLSQKADCITNSTCLTPFIYSLNKKVFWNGNNMNSKIQWYFQDTTITDFKACRTFKNGGYHKYEIQLNSLGCKDTLRDSIFIQDVKANVSYLSRKVYCSELKQFFDSSTFFKKPGDSIKRYAWQFGNGVYSSFVKNPLQVLNTSLDKIHVFHAVETISGCTDTIEYDIQIVGPKPYFTILDTIGCGSLQAVFKNLSKNCKSYIWEFGDPNLSNYRTDSAKNVSFDYTQPGRYFIHLTGLDTVYNDISGNTYYCKTTFPDKVFQTDTNRSVMVLPYVKANIAGPDTICLGSNLILKSLSDSGYQYDYWQMDDGTNYNKASMSTIIHQYKKEGTYLVKLNPGYLSPPINNECRDSAQKKILVLGVKADFNTDPALVPPLFQFYNKSSPIGANLKWEFGQPFTGSNNTSSDENPQHNFGKDTGHYNVCLIASLPYGCSDTVCKSIFNNHLSDFQLFNVFTPGTLDGKNDYYDVLIEGESLYDLQIYDRWGVLVFKGNSDGDATNQNNWNGKVMNTGAECPSGTYYYLFKYSLQIKPQEVKLYSGVITLIR